MPTLRGHVISASWPAMHAEFPGVVVAQRQKGGRDRQARGCAESGPRTVGMLGRGALSGLAAVAMVAQSRCARACISHRGRPRGVCDQGALRVAVRADGSVGHGAGLPRNCLRRSRKINHSATARLISQPAPMNTALASSPRMLVNRYQGRWVRTCVPAPSREHSHASSRLGDSGCRASERRRSQGTETPPSPNPPTAE